VSRWFNPNREWLVVAIDRATFWLPPFILGVIGAIIPPDNNWDLANYHFYNAWSFLNGRFDDALLPAGLPSFYNPYLDVPFYLGNAYLPPRLVAFLLALAHGFCFPPVYRLARILLFPQPTLRDIGAAALVATAGITGAISISEIATTFYDYVGAIALAYGVLLLTTADNRSSSSVNRPPTRMLIAGLVLGAAVGLKQTNFVFAVGLAVALPLLARNWREAAINEICFGAGGIVAALAIGGQWALFLWRNFHSPIFPLFNWVFHAPLAPPSVMFTDEYLPHGLTETLFYPFIFFLDPKRVGPILSYDLRMAALETAIVAGFLLLLMTHRRMTPAGQPDRRRILLFLLVALGFAYAMWLELFSVGRYAMAFDLFAPVVCLMVVAELPWPRWRFPIGAAILVIVMAVMQPGNWGRSNWNATAGGIVSVTMPQMGQVPGDLVLLHGAIPNTFLAPWFPPATQVIQTVFLAVDGDLSRFEPERTCRIAKHHGRIFAVIDGIKVPLTPKIRFLDLGMYGLRVEAQKCAPIPTSLHGARGHLLCPVERIQPPNADDPACAATERLRQSSSVSSIPVTSGIDK
jgi:hypothetical protein